MKKVFFIIPILGGGGAERVILHLLRHMDRERFEPNLVLFIRKGDLLDELPSYVKVFVLINSLRIYNIFVLRQFIFLKLARLLAKEKPDVVVSFLWYTNMITIFAKLLSMIKCRVVVSERNNLSFSLEGRFVKFMHGLVIRILYPIVDTVVVNSMIMAKDLNQMFNLTNEKIATIYNPIDISMINQLCKDDIKYPWFSERIPIIIGIGRLTLQKGFSYLIKSLYHLVVEEDFNIRLVIIGEGVQKNNLQRLAIELGVADRVTFLGFQKNPYKYLNQSTIFVLSSLHEGLPNVLLEAIALGVPSIATRCPTGPEEILTDGVNGILVQPADETALAEAIKRLLQDEGLRERLGEAGKKRAEYFRVEKIIRQYEDVIEGACARR